MSPATRHPVSHPVWAAAVSSAVAVSVALWLSATVAVGADGVASHSAQILLSNSLSADSEAYRSLTAIGLPSRIERLDMTRSEIWDLPRARVRDTLAAARARGLSATEIGADGNHLLAPMPPGQAKPPAEQEKLARMTSGPAVAGMSMMMLPDAGMIEHALTAPGGGRSDGTGRSSLRIRLTETLEVSADRMRVEKTSDGYIWHGTIDGSPLNPVTLMWWPAGRLTGTVTYRGDMYVLQNMSGAMHGVMKLAPEALPPEHAPVGPEMMKAMRMQVDPLVTKGDASMLRSDGGGAPSGAPPSPRPGRSDTRTLEDAPIQDMARAATEPAPGALSPAPGPAVTGTGDVEISVLVAYTAAAASHYTDIGKDLVLLALEQANDSFRSSGVGGVRLVPAHVYETGYIEKGSHFDHVFQFADKGDGIMEEVHELRDRYQADVAVLIVHDPMGCGLAAQIAAPAERAFAVVHHACAATMYSLAHEIGHLIGARHDPALDDSSDPFAYGHGFVHERAWRTMMSYKESCEGCPRLPLWSNPAVAVDGVPAGDAVSNNARVIAEQARRVAAFR